MGVERSSLLQSRRNTLNSHAVEILGKYRQAKIHHSQEWPVCDLRTLWMLTVYAGSPEQSRRLKKQMWSGVNEKCSHKKDFTLLALLTTHPKLMRCGCIWKQGVDRSSNFSHCNVSCPAKSIPAKGMSLSSNPWGSPSSNWE